MPKLCIEESPKTSGSISKNFLTPCRRVGLSKNWRKGFVSPLANTKYTENQIENKEPSKRKKVEFVNDGQNETLTEKNDSFESETTVNFASNVYISDIVATPSRNLVLTRRKRPNKTATKTRNIKTNNLSQNQDPSLTTPTKNSTSSKPDTFSLKATSQDDNTENISSPIYDKENISIDECSAKPNYKDQIINKWLSSTQNYLTTDTQNDIIDHQHIISELEFKINKIESELNNGTALPTSQSTEVDGVEPLLEPKSSQINSNSEHKSKNEIKVSENQLNNKDSKQLNDCVSNQEKQSTSISHPVKSPSDLTKKCFVIVKKHIIDKTTLEEYKKQNTTSNIVCDTQVKKIDGASLDEDFVPFQSQIYAKQRVKTINPNEQTSSNKPKKQKIKETQPKINNSNASSQFSFANDNDDDFEMKTTHIKKPITIPNLQKSKSTGSITTKDINELKARLRRKKNLYLARIKTPETEELRELIKKWRKGCQDALQELLELMKKKFPDKNMDYSELLQTLKIPPSLVGYDSDNDSFLSSDDDNMFLSDIPNISLI